MRGKVILHILLTYFAPQKSPYTSLEACIAVIPVRLWYAHGDGVPRTFAALSCLQMWVTFAALGPKWLRKYFCKVNSLSQL